MTQQVLCKWRGPGWGTSYRLSDCSCGRCPSFWIGGSSVIGLRTGQPRNRGSILGSFHTGSGTYPAFYSVIRLGVLLGDKTVRAWSWPLSSIWCQEVKNSCNCTSSRPRATTVFVCRLYFFASQRYTPEGRGFDSWWCRWQFFNWLNPSGSTMA